MTCLWGQLRWWRSRRILGFPRPTNTAVLRSNHLEHPRNLSVEGQKDLQGWREIAWQVWSVWMWMGRGGKEKNSGAAEGREPFPWKDKRERERACESATLHSQKSKTSLDQGLGSKKYWVSDGFLKTAFGAETIWGFGSVRLSPLLSYGLHSWAGGGSWPRSVWCGVGIPGAHWDRTAPPCSTFGRGYIAFQRTKDPAGVIKRPFISVGQRHVQRTNSWLRFFQCYVIDSKHRCRHRPLPGTKDIRHSKHPTKEWVD